MHIMMLVVKWEQLAAMWSCPLLRWGNLGGIAKVRTRAAWLLAMTAISSS